MNMQLVTLAAAPPHRFSAGVAETQEVLTFRRGDEEFGISLLCVQEIRPCQVPTRLAGADHSRPQPTSADRRYRVAIGSVGTPLQ